MNSKRCPLGTLKNAATPLSREPHSLKIRTLKSAFLNNSKTQKNDTIRCSNKIVQEIHNDVNVEQGTDNGQNKKTTVHKSTKNELHSITSNNTLDMSTPKRPNFVKSSCKRTPPLCRCGRRATCKVANSPGPNQGRSFFACPNQKRSLGMLSKTCRFFMWC